MAMTFSFEERKLIIDYASICLPNGFAKALDQLNKKTELKYSGS